MGVSRKYGENQMCEVTSTRNMSLQRHSLNLRILFQTRKFSEPNHKEKSSYLVDQVQLFGRPRSFNGNTKIKFTSKILIINLIFSTIMFLRSPRIYLKYLTGSLLIFSYPDIISKFMFLLLIWLSSQKEKYCIQILLLSQAQFLGSFNLSCTL